MYNWVTTTTVDETEEFSSIQYIYIYEYDDIVYNEKDN